MYISLVVPAFLSFMLGVLGHAFKEKAAKIRPLALPTTVGVARELSRWGNMSLSLSLTALTAMTTISFVAGYTWEGIVIGVFTALMLYSAIRPLNKP
jgi:hypothetical protein